MDNDPLAELNRRLGIVRDRIRAVAMRRSNGFYLFGRPGTSKTHTVRTTLEQMKSPYHYHQGHLAPMGLFDLLAEYHDRVICLDDLSNIFNNAIVMQILLAALGNQPDDTGVRTIRYRRQGRNDTIRFTGGIICISNLELQTNPLIDALKSRVHYLRYEPTDEQIAALMYQIAAKGYRALNKAECIEVVDYLLAECDRLGIRPDIRLLVDKAFPDRLLCKEQRAETHWKDLIRSTIEEQLVDLQETPVRGSMTRSDQKKHEQEIVRQIVMQHESPDARLEAWHIQTGKGKRSFYRRLNELS